MCAPNLSVAAVLAPSVVYCRRGRRRLAAAQAYMDRLDTMYVIPLALSDEAAVELGRRPLRVAARRLGVPPEALTRRRRVGPIAERLRRLCRGRARRRRRRVMVGRMEEATRCLKDWAMLWVTLTVAPGQEQPVFCKGSRAWGNFIKRMEHAVPGFRYAACVERGRLHGRLHIHATFWVPELPEPWSRDPGRRGRRELLIPERSVLWPHGWSSWVPVRTSRGDHFGRRGWFWPRESDGAAVEAADPGRIAGYMTKYMAKDSASRRGGDAWRMRMTRGLGSEEWIRALRKVKGAALQAVQTPWMILAAVPPAFRPSQERMRQLGAMALRSMSWPSIWRNIWKERSSPITAPRSSLHSVRRILQSSTVPSSGRFVVRGVVSEAAIDDYRAECELKLRELAVIGDRVWSTVLGA